MSLCYSDDLRIRVVRAVDNGISRRGAAAGFQLGSALRSAGRHCGEVRGLSELHRVRKNAV